MKIVDDEIKVALIKKGYNLENKTLKIKSTFYNYMFNIYIDNKLVEIYDARQKQFFN